MEKQNEIKFGQKQIISKEQINTKGLKSTNLTGPTTGTQKEINQ
jgi:hypothetical protein